MSVIPPEVAALVDRFARNRDAYRSPAYNEAQTRREFIDPLFKALGWDVDNESGLAEAYKDVIHEDAIKVGGASKAPDYCFRIGGTRKFFVEAKKPAVGLETDPEPAYQLRRYAWTSKLPLSILTDFEEFAVYDCRILPKVGDKASVARVFYGTCDQYADHWDYIAGLFSKDAVLKGAFDKYAESNKRKKGTAEVDAEFLKQIEDWRLALAQNLALRNPQLSVRDLNFAVQRTIDRLIFLRMCEDRGVEIYGGLLSLCATAVSAVPPDATPLTADTAVAPGTLYQRLAVLFRRADEKYNSGLFYFTAEAGREPPDTFTLDLTLDDRVLRDIIKSLYYPESPYEFSVLPPEVLGQVYEQFLGKVIRLTAGHHAKVEEKPEVRKAGGVYYTPAYIVDYIVKNTVGKLLEGKTPTDIGPDVAADPRVGRRGVASPPRGRRGRRATAVPAVHPLRILDPACGSGSFLLGAYQFLLNWHRDWYVAEASRQPSAVSDQPEAGAQSKIQNLKSKIYQGAGGQWLLTIQEKKRILLNHIYGVDIDPQAVETTKLSLLLKVLEGESEQTIGSTLRLFHERALPDLDKNIKCGNSLIGPDFYDGQQMTMFDEDERLRINAFDWAAEFPEVFRGSGSGSRVSGSGSQAPSPESRAPSPAPGFDAVIGNPPYGADYTALEKAYFQSRYIYKKGKPETYIFFIERGLQVLRPGGTLGYITPNAWLTNYYGAQIRRHVLSNATLQHVVDLEPTRVFVGAVVDTAVTVAMKGIPDPCATTCVSRGTANHEIRRLFEASQNTWSLDPDALINLQANPREISVLTKVEASGQALGGLVEYSQGVIPYKTKADGGKNLHIASQDRTPDWLALIERASQVRRYQIAAPESFIHYGPWLWCAREPRFFSQPKILFHRLRKKLPTQLVGALECTGAVNRHALSNLILRPNLPDTTLVAVLALFNSRLANWWFVKRYGLLMEVGGFKVAKIPLPARWSEGHDRLVALVRQMLDFHKQLGAAKTPAAQTGLQRQIDATDRQIDQLVYQLYALTDDEIRIVEEATAR